MKNLESKEIPEVTDQDDIMVEARDVDEAWLRPCAMGIVKDHVAAETIQHAMIGGLLSPLEWYDASKAWFAADGCFISSIVDGCFMEYLQLGWPLGDGCFMDWEDLAKEVLSIATLVGVLVFSYPIDGILKVWLYHWLWDVVELAGLLQVWCSLQLVALSWWALVGLGGVNALSWFSVYGAGDIYHTNRFL
ncbi:hypothetical protein U1Q18_030312 [Sarracenia purpurea var. burkii]